MAVLGFLLPPTARRCGATIAPMGNAFIFTAHIFRYAFFYFPAFVPGRPIVTILAIRLVPPLAVRKLTRGAFLRAHDTEHFTMLPLTGHQLCMHLRQLKNLLRRRFAALRVFELSHAPAAPLPTGDRLVVVPAERVWCILFGLLAFFESRPKKLYVVCV